MLNTFAGGTANVVVVAVQSLVLTPLFLRHVGQRLYGAWLGSGDVLLWLQAFDLGIPNVLIQRIGAAHGRGAAEEVGRWLGNGMLALLAAAAIITGAGVWVARYVPGWFGLGAADAAHLTAAFTLGTLAIGGLILSHLALAYSRGVQRTGMMNVVALAAAIAGFVVTLLLLLAGLRLMAIAWGLVARTVVLLAGSALFLARAVPQEVWRHARPHGATLRELGRIMPLTAVGGISFAVMYQSELALVGAILGPAAATAFMITRRASELARALVDTISWSTYGSFAHLVTSDARSRSLHAYAEIFSLRDSASVAFASAYVAANASLVSVWVGPELFGGAGLTTLIAVQAVVTGGAFLANYLYRASGAVGVGSAALAVEAALRVGLSVLLLRTGFGVAAIPVAAISTGLVAWWIARAWTVRDLSPFADPAPRTAWKVWAIRAALFAAAVTVGATVEVASWTVVLALGAAFGGGGLLLLLMVDPKAATARDGLRRGLKTLKRS